MRTASRLAGPTVLRSVWAPTGALLDRSNGGVCEVDLKPQVTKESEHDIWLITMIEATLDDKAIIPLNRFLMALETSSDSWDCAADWVDRESIFQSRPRPKTIHFIIRPSASQTSADRIGNLGIDLNRRGRMGLSLVQEAIFQSQPIIRVPILLNYPLR
jgi:hypothetical protein